MSFTRETAKKYIRLPVLQQDRIPLSPGLRNIFHTHIIPNTPIPEETADGQPLVRVARVDSHLVQDPNSVHAWDALKKERGELAAIATARVFERVISYGSSYPPFGLVTVKAGENGELVAMPATEDMFSYTYQRTDIVDDRFIADMRKVIAIIGQTFLFAIHEEVAYSRSAEVDPLLEKVYQRLNTIAAFGRKYFYPFPGETFGGLIQAGAGTAVSFIESLLSQLHHVQTQANREELITGDVDFNVWPSVSVDTYMKRFGKSKQLILDFATHNVELFYAVCDQIMDPSKPHTILPELFYVMLAGALAGGIDISEQTLQEIFQFIPSDHPVRLDFRTIGCVGLVPGRVFKDMPHVAEGMHYNNVVSGFVDLVAGALEAMLIAPAA